MRNVIARCARKTRRAPLAACRAVGVLDGEVKPTHKRSPAHTRGAQQIAYVLPFHAHDRTAGADIAQWVGIVNHRERPGAPIYDSKGGCRSGNVSCAVGLASNKV